MDLTLCRSTYVRGLLSVGLSSLMREDTGAPMSGESDDLWHWQQKQVAYRTQHPFQFMVGDRNATLLSVPQSEQDVIGLFHELMGLGVLRG
jgi:hypothetical protein